MESESTLWKGVSRQAEVAAEVGEVEQEEVEQEQAGQGEVATAALGQASVEPRLDRLTARTLPKQRSPQPTCGNESST
jgi:hypothetical protein